MTRTCRRLRVREDDGGSLKVGRFESTKMELEATTLTVK